jgi:cell division protease FtsH
VRHYGRKTAEQVTGRISTGALKAKQKREQLFGLNDKIGNVTYYDSTGQSEYNFAKPYSEETAKSLEI